MKSFRCDYARGRNIFSLNGPWHIAPSEDSAPHQYSHRITVPSVVDCAQPHHDWQSARFHWYRTTFTLDCGPGALVYLNIGQSQFGTDVWVNGIHAGRSISCYTAHEYEIRGFLHSTGQENEIVVRVGRKEELPPESAVGKDQEKSIYTPGIWGDVALVVSGNPRVNSVQIIPDIRKGNAEVRVMVENRKPTPASVTVSAQASEKKGSKKASRLVRISCSIAANSSRVVSLNVPHDDPHLWSPESPFLYRMVTTLHGDAETCDEVETTYGLREFTVEGKSFLLNGEKIILKGGNIAFHRFLSDKERGLLPWDRSWIKQVLVDMPKSHHFNFFRNHLGQLYPLWYDIADEEGMLIQNEWHFWGATGSKEQIRKEFREWLRDNWNHPSIVIWDPLNESADEFIQNEVVPEMKLLDPTRPWESVDFIEEHPYIYSLGPVLNERPFGFTRALLDIEHSQKPVVLNEFIWWWVNNAGKPTTLMDGVVQRWLGKTWTREDLLEHQAFLAAELIELFRRINVDAIQPFVYLSNNDGPTAHWFHGSIAELHPKPLLEAIRNAYAPFGVSVELWDRHFAAGEQRTIRVFVFNDSLHKESGELRWGISDSKGTLGREESRDVSLEPHEHKVIEVEFVFPKEPGRYKAHAKVRTNSESAVSTKLVHVFSPLKIPEKLQVAEIGLSEEARDFLRSSGITCVPFSGNPDIERRALVVGEGHGRGQIPQKVVDFVRAGGSLVLLEPELGVDGSEILDFSGDLRIEIKRREDRDKGGYDSYVFMENPSHQLWRGIAQEHLFLFNGAVGGEIVSQHDLILRSPHTVHARSGLNLGVIAIAEASLGRGKVLVSRLQTRGRLLSTGGANVLFARRTDPVAQQYFLNLLSYAGKGGDD